jgi:hypothetical protein
MTMRLAGALALALAVAALASASAYAGSGNGNGHGNGNEKGTSEPTAAVAATPTGQESSGHGNSANAPGQVKKDEATASSAVPASSVSSVGQDAGTAQAGVKPSNDTAHDTHAAASSDQTKLYGNGKTAGEIAMQNGAAPSTVLHGPGTSQPHKAAHCSGGHEVDVHALKAKRGKACGTQPESPPSPAPHPSPSPDPGTPGGDPVQGPTPGGSTPITPASPASVRSTPSALGRAVKPKPTKPKPVVSPREGRVESASGVLSATGVVGAETLPFTGFPIWIVVLIGLGLMVLGLILRRRSSAPSL